MTTLAATDISGTGATLNGTANPNGAPTTGWFRYATTNPGTCNDTFGTRAPASGGSTLGAGTSPVAYLQPVTGLSPGTTYFFCAIAQNGAGTSVGSVLSVHHAGRAHRHHRSRVEHRHHDRDAQRLRQPERRRDHRLVPLRHDQPGHLQRQLRHARTADQRLDAGRRHQRRQLRAGAHRRCRRTRPTTSARSPRTARASSFGSVRSFVTPPRADGADGGCVQRRQHGGHAQRLGEPERRHDDGLVPLRHHQPRHLQRQLRHARSRQRRLRPRRGQRRDAVRADADGPGPEHDLLLLRDRLELGRDFVRRGALVHDAGARRSRPPRRPPRSRRRAPRSTAPPTRARPPRPAASATPRPAPAPATTPSARAFPRRRRHHARRGHRRRRVHARPSPA